MSRAAKIAIAFAGFVIALNVALALIHSLTGGTPGGPPSSSYTTAPEGVAAYAALLARAGHRVTRLQVTPKATQLDHDTTVVLLAPDRPVETGDADALRRFVDAGGRLVVAGPAGGWLDRIVPDAPVWSPSQVRSPHVLAPAGEIAHVNRVEAGDRGAWHGGAALPLLGADDDVLLSVAVVGAGRVLLLAGPDPLQNRLLGHADDAALGLALAGPPSRPVAFLETYHGYGAATTGFAAVPGRWWTAFGLLALATLMLMVASGRRFGPPQADERALPPPRREYVESLGGVLARSQPRDAAVRPVRARAERLIVERARLGQAPSVAELRAAAIRLGVAPDEADALLQPARTDADVLALGRLLAGLQRESRP